MVTRLAPTATSSSAAGAVGGDAGLGLAGADYAFFHVAANLSFWEAEAFCRVHLHATLAPLASLAQAGLHRGLRRLPALRAAADDVHAAARSPRSHRPRGTRARRAATPMEGW